MIKFLTKIIGSKNERELKRLQVYVDQINDIEKEIKGLADDQLKAKTAEFKQKLDSGASLEDILAESFAVVRETAKRTLNMRHFDVQLIGGVVLHDGKIAEMKTGEGKTLAATLPVYLNALTGKGVHVVTVNDYLARRDSEWMGTIYKFLGLTVGLIQHDMPDDKRKKAYTSDVIYGTNNEFGFDYLRDNMKFSLKDYVQRELNYAIIDEVDSILIDEARTPLIISGPSEESTDKYYHINSIIPRLQKEKEIRRQLKEGDDYFIDKKDKNIVLTEEGIKNVNSFLTTECNKPSNRNMLQLKEEIDYKIQLNERKKDKKSKRIELTKDGVEKTRKLLYADYQIDEKSNTVSLTEEGVPKVEKLLSVENLYDPLNIETLHHVNQALKAHVLFKKDVDYVVKDGEVIIVDEFTGRLMPGRRYSEGLHQALEAKEGVKIESENQTLATITFQNYFRMYNKLAGMTGTADTEAEEFHTIYNLEVVVIPTNKPLNRENYPDVIYRTEREKFNAVIEEIVEMNKNGRPVLVGTISIENSEKVSRLLKKKGIRHHVLNAKHHEREAEIVADAGQNGSVTIATNMAGRGTDIVLGEDVAEAGGLHILATERHESRRIDNQLRGRSGRQGDPGSSRFYLSLEDDLLRIFGSDRISGVMERLGMVEGQPVEHKLITRAIENAQKRVEGNNFEIRKHLLEYDDVMNKQREVIYGQRRQVLEGDNLKDQIMNMTEDVLSGLIDMHVSKDDHFDDWDMQGLQEALTRQFSISLRINGTEELIIANKNRIPIDDISMEILKDRLLKEIEEMYAEKEKEIGEERIRQLERMIMLQIIDSQWKDHLLAMDHLKEGIGLRGYARQDPLNEYKKEGFEIFSSMIERIKEEITSYLLKVQVHTEDDTAYLAKRPSKQRMFEHRGETPQTGRGEGVKQATVKRDGKKVGRNDPCPCGSGRKYKKCCGK